MRLPARLVKHPIVLIEHPVETVIAGLLLMALLFVSGEPASSPAAKAAETVAQKS
ncbi:MAG TPA: hypothetical protein VG501_07790 [Rhizomicrobium sp.]|nr:hypothetical protein [Rhizomicrobium sp.]